MRAALGLTVGLAISVPSHAATLEQIVQVVTLPAQATAAAPGWPNLDRLGVKWNKASPQQGPAGYTKFGTVKLDGLGKTTVFFIGSRAELSKASLGPPEGIDKTEFGATLKRLLPTAQIKLVRAGCKDEGVVGGSAVYQVDLPGKRPAYVLMMSGTSKAGLDTSVDIFAQLSKDLNCGR
jgi:hypothetical protein